MSQASTDFNIRFNAESATFSKDVDYAKKMLRGYTKEANAANDATGNFSKKLIKGADQTKAFGDGVIHVAGAITASIGILTGATTVLIRKQAEQARQLEKQAVVAGIAVEEIQALSYASKQYGVSGEKFSDILKDVNDKLGDFAATGGGEFKDFFEQVAPKVGLTIQELQRMAGPEALIAIKAALDEANVPMQEQIFYLEAIANDASALMPLLDKQGEKLYELTKKYDDLNVAMSEHDIESFKQMDQELEDMALKLERSFSIAVLGAREQIGWLSEHIASSVSWWGELFDSWTDNPRTTNGLVKRLGDLREDAKSLQHELKQAQIELADLENTKQQAKGNPSQEAFLKYKGWDSRISKAKDKVSGLTSELNKLNSEIDANQKQYEVKVFGMHEQPKLKSSSTENTSIPVESSFQTQGSSKLSSLDNLYASEFEKLQLSHQERLTEIENFQLSEQEIKRRGYESLEALKTDYIEREKEYATEQEEAYFQKLDEQMQRELDSFAKKEEQKNNIAEQKAQQRAATQQRLDQQVMGMQFAIASQTLGLIASTAEEGSGIQKAAFIAQQAMAAGQIYMQGEVAAAAALAPPPIGLGPAAGAPYAASIRGMTALSMGLVLAQTVAGMAHEGMTEIPSEGSWYLDKGERVYTNESAQKLDYMYDAIMTLYSRDFSTNFNPSTHLQSNQQQNSNVSSGWTFVFNEAPQGSHVQDVDDERKVISFMMKDASESGQYYSYLSKKLGVKGGGLK